MDGEVVIVSELKQTDNLLNWLQSQLELEALDFNILTQMNELTYYDSSSHKWSVHFSDRAALIIVNSKLVVVDVTEGSSIESVEIADV
ncbi:hypothetical protein QH639_20805 [Lysinibacillus sp. 1 U-2021]|uniref:hypothetical protein n=1 Tax=Lysinibacillus sp. 1 U-2021 TaxID=3039426 RepID=UPI00247FB709|nr:hypothetical protein [Lysinibacillus sp. 1 U-2021]WGT38228.1 hypothetical protein QH639_20805 [Lysinibacillus sp. 1 U-2021]